MRDNDHVILESLYTKIIKESVTEENERPKIGIYINNDGKKKFMNLILSGQKTIETRNNQNLSEYAGQRIGLIRTGKGSTLVMGYATLGNPIVYNNEEEFRKDQDKHHVLKGDERDILNSPKSIKYGYPLVDVEIEPDPYPPKEKKSPLKKRYTATVIN
jgi:hypothetical protein